MESNLNQAMHQKHLKKIGKWMAKEKLAKWKSVEDKSTKWKLLDLGCGSGYFLKFAQFRGWEVQGVEMSNYAAEIARKQGLNVLTKSVTEAAFPDGTFDVITMFNVLEHMTNLNEVMANNYRWLKVGGLLVIEVPNVNSLQRKIFGGNWVHWDVPRHIFHFSSETIHELAEKHGFKVIEEYSLPFSSHEVAGWLNSLSFMLRGNPVDGKIRENYKKHNKNDGTNQKENNTTVVKYHNLKLLIVLTLSYISKVIPDFLNIKPGVKTYLLNKV
ncbi:class I SAM-dependent methyltransferase [Candidatus Woesearchaeota archaeon]|nr:class I SAM-dependent methyltransferase [Candidatus Woesearchaeota archaeon]